MNATTTVLLAMLAGIGALHLLTISGMLGGIIAH